MRDEVKVKNEVRGTGGAWIEECEMTETWIDNRNNDGVEIGGVKRWLSGFELKRTGGVEGIILMRV